MTETQKIWLKTLYLNAASEFNNGARNLHLMAIGSETQEGAVQLEGYADEQRNFSKILTEMANAITFD